MSTGNGALVAHVRVHFAREYHVGAGHGDGTALDSALFTEDARGAEEPAVRAGHGFLRQALHDLLTAPPLAAMRRCTASGDENAATLYCLPDAEQPPCPVCRIFGSAAHPSPWSFGTLRPADPLPTGQTHARVASRTAVDASTRRARDGQLFSQELGAPLAFELVARRAPATDADEALDELALLAAAARAVRGVGAGRRRGRGECRVEVVPDGGEGPDALLARFQEAWLGESPRADRRPAPARGALARTAASAALWAAPESPAWEEVRLTLRLDEPVVAGTRPLTGNLLDSEPFVPGSLLLGALAGAVLERGAATEEEFLRAFVCGGVRFPDLLPVAEAGGRWRPTLPAPRDLHTCTIEPGPKAEGGHGFWSTLGLGPGESPGCPVCAGENEGKPRRLDGFLFDGGGAFLARGGSRWEVPAALREETKIQIDPATGRVLGRSLYHRQAIPAGTLLSGVLRARPGALDPLRAAGLLCDGEGTAALRVGKRHGRGYGAVRLHWAAIPAAETEAARERTRARVAGLLKEQKPISLVAGSRVALRDGWGRTLQSLDPAALGLQPGWVAAHHASVAVRPVGGFRRHVGLPRRQGVALAPGSVLRVTPAGLGEADREAFLEALVELAHGGGAGERTEEGFGRFAVAPFVYDWTSDEPGDGAAPEEHDVPAALRLARDPADDPLGRGRRERLFAQLSARVRALGIAPDDRWRAVARLLYARAGQRSAELARWLEEPGGAVADALVRARAAREARSFLRDKDGKVGWAALRPLLDEAAADGLCVDERAFRTRVLADALADAIAPGKVNR